MRGRGHLEIRRPTQKRGRERFEAILDAAERLLEDADPSQISVYDIANSLGVSPPSIYHFFPDASLVFVALAERYLERFQAVSTEVIGPVKSWQELLEILCGRAREIYATSKAARKVLLGSGYSPEVRRRDLATDGVLAGRLLEELHKRFVLPDIPDLRERICEMILINDALWMLSFHREGRISETAEERARLARVAYLRLTLPETLHAREQPVSTANRGRPLPLEADTGSRAKRSGKVGGSRTTAHRRAGSKRGT